MRILLLTDRDWTHPQAGGTGTNLLGQVSRWVDAGHEITVIAGSYDGAVAVERPCEGLEIHRMGTRLTVFARAAQASRRGVGADADVVLEVVNGIAFFTPLWWWLRAPRVTLVHHVHQERYVQELGLRGRIAALLLERLPLTLYRNQQFLTISNASRDALVALGVDAAAIDVHYLGVEADAFYEGPRATHPALLYLGSLKQYKRLDVLLDVLEAVPGAHLDIAGEGDHRAALEAEIAARDLSGRVTLHGFVDEHRKRELYAQAWVNLTASSAESGCLTVIEAAACGTPSAALAVGGLPESIVDGETGVLAAGPDELARSVAALVRDPERAGRLGEAARTRARGFGWDATAAANLRVLERVAATPRPRLRDALLRSQTGTAAGLAAAVLANNVIQLGFTVLFTRLLGADGYGALAAIVSAFLILGVGGQAVQVAAARETTLGTLGDAGQTRRTIEQWTFVVLLAALALFAAGALAREPLAALLGVEDHAWAAAAIAPSGALWLLLSLQRGALQGLHAYGPVGASLIAEALARIVCALALFAVGLGVTGAFLGAPLAWALVSLVLWRDLAKRLGTRAPGREAVRRLGSLVGDNWVPIFGLLLLAVLQNVDVIIARRELGEDRAGSYAAAAVAARTVVWVAMGVGLQLLPEAARRAAEGLDPRPVLMRALAVLAVVATPALAVFALVPELLLRLAFGPGLTESAGALPLLGVAMTLLAIAYLCVQYMVALGALKFVWVLAVIVIAEPFLLSAGNFGPVSFAGIVLGLQLAAASAALTLALRARPAAPAP